MERKDAVGILKEMVVSEINGLSWGSLQATAFGDYTLQIGSGYNRDAIKEFIEKNNLTLHEDTNKQFLIVCKTHSPK
jgi:hypothetical protein